jgi:GT2 family glycosyltransferase
LNRNANAYLGDRFPKPKIIVLIVLYKTSLIESKTVQSIKKQDRSQLDCKLIIWDNSPLALLPSELDITRSLIGEFEYISTPENVWLSKVYNRVLGSHTFDFAILLDQDSTMPSNFFSELLLHIQHNKEINLFLPLVMNSGKLVSPGSFFFFKGKHWKKPKTGLIRSKNVLAITSGMIISGKYLKENNIKFDERLSLYAIDTAFMLEFSRHERFLYVLPVIFEHNTLLWSNPSADELLPRFRNLKDAWVKILSERPVALIFAKTYAVIVSLKLAIKYRDSRFLE